MGVKQLGFLDYELTTAKKQIKWEKFLSEMEVVVPCQALIDLIRPHYPKTSKIGGRPTYLSSGLAAGPSPAAVLLA